MTENELEITAPDGMPEGEAVEETEETESTEAEASEEHISIDDELSALAEEFPVLCDGSPESHLNTERYEELRALGVTPREAFLATVKPRGAQDDRAHLGAGVPKRARVNTGAMSMSDLRSARAIFTGMSDEQIRDLYRRVTK